MKMRVQAQHLQAGDIVGSGERIIGVLLNSTKFASNKALVTLRKGETSCRSIQWGKYTIINIERPEKVVDSFAEQDGQGYSSDYHWGKNV